MTEDNRSSVDTSHCVDCIRNFGEWKRLQDKALNCRHGNKPIPFNLQNCIDKINQAFNSALYSDDKRCELVKVCFLKERSNRSCSQNAMTIYLPTRLQNSNKHTLDAWISHFSELVGISASCARELSERCAEVRLCATRTNFMKRALHAAQLLNNRCSLCCASESRSLAVSLFNWEKIRTRQENVCVTEDTLAISRWDNVCPADIERLCDICRRWFLRDIDVRRNQPRDTRLSKDYGRTPIAIMRTVQFILDEIQKPDTIVVRLRTAVEVYHMLVRSSGESHIAYKTYRSISEHLQPSLAFSGILLRTGARKDGSYFCTIREFDELSKPQQESTSFSMKPQDMRELLCEMKDYIVGQTNNIFRGEWSLIDFIRHSPTLPWRFHSILLDCPLLLRRGRADARLNGTKPEGELPLNPKECPDSLLKRAPYEFNFALQVYYTLERNVFLPSNRTVRGPITMSLSLSSIPNTSVSFLSVLNRLGCTVSYAKVYEWRHQAIKDREERGPFRELVPTAFTTVAVDNINIRAAHSLTVHGSTYVGFDGFAVQAVNSNVNFNYQDYFNSLPASQRLPRYEDYVSREEYIEQRFPSPGKDPDISGYKTSSSGQRWSTGILLLAEMNQNRRALERLSWTACREDLEGKLKMSMWTSDIAMQMTFLR